MSGNFKVSSLVSNSCRIIYYYICVNDTKLRVLFLIRFLTALQIELCYSMPDMDGCAEWKMMCTNTAASTWPFCDFSTDDSTLPPMRMWFHVDLQDVILFKEWVPRNALAFAGSWFAVALLAFVAEFLRFCRQRAEEKWKLERLGKHDTSFQVNVDVPRALFHTAQLGWGYIVM